MKLSDLKTLKEADNEYIVYKVSSPNTDRVYYAYTVGRDVRKAFLTGAERSAEPDRGDVRMMAAAGDDPETLRFQMLDVFADEISAFMERNDLRAADSLSITGPTNFPTAMFQRARAMDPDRVKKWKLTGDINSATAREAMGDAYKGVAAYTFADLKTLVAGNPKIKAELTADLDRLTYPAFKTKYFPSR